MDHRRSSQLPVFAAHVAAGRHPALLDTCEKLADSITDAVHDGSLDVADRVVRDG
ncbi:hypothetical protein QRX50_44470 [Amycolatopsis carbonis]|uniref:Uncharacterized protein n=1 Tax=Amycolatopsis carbonis TaxID=715471 RepID=A0A9Y2IHB1_9PSEU|nr:hypothetical protein [Amycolatopsis sp. 2-15]WIX78343.1 hypothetical protein QRX50_44470 [Amycolatopsis sp. 2-15]